MLCGARQVHGGAHHAVYQQIAYQPRVVIHHCAAGAQDQMRIQASIPVARQQTSARWSALTHCQCSLLFYRQHVTVFSSRYAQNGYVINACPLCFTLSRRARKQVYMYWYRLEAAPCSDSGCARMVGLDAAEGDDCVGAILQRLGDQKLELPYLRTPRRNPLTRGLADTVLVRCYAGL